MISLLIITTGGPFDKEYAHGVGVRNLSFGKISAVVKTFDRVGMPEDWAVYPLFAKDSLGMSDADRAQIAEVCAKAPCRSIMVTHGTDTMVRTAGVIARKRLKKIIVLTGAAQPARMSDSDADFNLGFATATAQLMKLGVYVAMNGSAFRWNQCRKNPDTSVLERK